MRDIKFRAWNRATKKYNYYVELYCYKDGSLGCSAGEENNNPVGNTSDFVLEQFTGLIDRNGKDIYEGDLVKVRGTKKVGEYVTEVVFKICGFQLETNNTYIVDGRCLIGTEVVGNIHEVSPNDPKH